MAEVKKFQQRYGDENEEDILTQYLRPESAHTPTTAHQAAPSGFDDMRQLEVIKKYLRPDETPSPPAPDAKPDEWWQGVKDDSWSGFAKRLGVGAVRGGKDVIDTAAHGLAAGVDYGAGKLAGAGIIPQSAADAVSASRQDMLAQDATGNNLFDKSYENFPSAGAGRLAGQVATSIPVMAAALPAGVMTGAAIPAVNGFAIPGSKLAGSVLSGAATGGAFGALTSSASPNSLAEDVGYGALGGAIVNPIAQGVGNALLGGVSRNAATLAQAAKDKFGIGLTGAQVSDSPAVKFLTSAIDRLPLSGAGAKKDAQQTAFNRAVSKTFGEDAERLTTDVMSKAKDRLGREFDTIAARSTIKADPQLGTDMMTIARDASSVISQGELRPILAQIKNVADKIDPASREISGDVYQALTRKGAPLDRAMQSADPNVRFYAGQVREALDSALERSAPPEMVQRLSQARGQWKAMKTVEDLVEKAPTGDISPALLMGQVRGSYGNMAYGGGGELSELARIGQRFLKEPPSSGTAERLMSLGLIGGGGGAISGGYDYAQNGDPVSAMSRAATGAIGTLAAGRIAGAALRNPLYTQALISRGLGTGGEPIIRPALTNVGAAGVNQIMAQPLEVTVRPRPNQLMPGQ